MMFEYNMIMLPIHQLIYHLYHIHKYNIDIDKNAIIENIDRIINQIFKLLPSREEGGDWQAPLQNLILEQNNQNPLRNDYQ